MKYEIGSITKMGMLEHVLLRYANETLNSYCYVNIILGNFCCAASVASKQQHKQDLRKIYRRGDEFSN